MGLIGLIFLEYDDKLKFFVKICCHYDITFVDGRMKLNNQHDTGTTGIFFIVGFRNAFFIVFLPYLLFLLIVFFLISGE